MNLGQIFSSLESWRKLSAVNMKPRIAYAILKYTTLVTGEQEIVEKQRVSLLYAVASAEPGTEVRLEPDSPEMVAFIEGFNRILSQKSDLKPIQMDMGEVVDALDGKDDVLSVKDLALLEPFFAAGVTPEVPVDE